jgi:hypothetical protein
MALGVASLSLGLALPFVLAQERGATGEKAGMEKCGCEEVSLDKSYIEIGRKLPTALAKEGFILAGEIDWNVLRSRGMSPHGGMPGETPRLDPDKVTNVKTYLFADEKLINKVFESPKHGFWTGRIVLCEEGGKTKLFYTKPGTRIEELKKAGVITEEKAAEHMEHAKEFERKVENVVNTLKAEK